MVTSAQNIIEDNFLGKKNSFIYALHENNVFDAKSFWELYNAIIDLVATEDRELLTKITSIYSYILEAILSHFGKNDGFKIKNLPVNYKRYTQRLTDAFYMFVTKNKIDEEKLRFEDDLINPKYIN